MVRCSYAILRAILVPFLQFMRFDEHLYNQFHSTLSYSLSFHLNPNRP